MFNQQQIGIGHYSQSGGGEGQLELGMRYSTGRSQLYFEQISDGRMVWSWANDGKPPRRVYLDRIRPLLGPNPRASSVATLHLAIGGQRGFCERCITAIVGTKYLRAKPMELQCGRLSGTLRQTPASPAARNRPWTFKWLVRRQTSFLLPMRGLG